MTTNPWAVEAPAPTCPVRRLVQRFGARTVAIAALGVVVVSLLIGGVAVATSRYRAANRIDTGAVTCPAGSHHVVMQALPGVSMSPGARQATTISECVPND